MWRLPFSISHEMVSASRDDNSKASVPVPTPAAMQHGAVEVPANLLTFTNGSQWRLEPATIPFSIAGGSRQAEDKHAVVHEVVPPLL